MNMFAKGLMSAAVTAGVAMTAPAFAGVPTDVRAPGFNKLETTSEYHRKRKKDRRYYARDERIDRDTRIWRGNDGRYYCKRDNGTTGLLIGGAVGGLAGHEIAGNGDKLLGTIIGAGAGALIGREIDRDKYRCR
ncbi:MAG: glycine zipper 2TM domain-containing protein [Sphingopyxis sp.]|uniref:glycine zipper 2TM domain-containing protein n=1 Tax=Sphingopyxis sp. TaxID=1908224 RepID=UPI002AB8DAAE|nr:glycine zipper 2TM domain-containing protein [Sphingopyxis sp.]MDZ3832552.1 glycine zipper 2TM domain-containing protein [Sphingopyxis sp.]